MRFRIEEYCEKNPPYRKWWCIMDTGYPNYPAMYDHQQVGINFAIYTNAQLVCDKLNEEWEAFQRNPW